ncbi:MAG: hypothetical protein KME55_32285 [Nostoc indistinguendum CM1-VF10]|nr:hypothetical protein [Nostoc indistinguendum CM1-VF10]
MNRLKRRGLHPTMTVKATYPPHPTPRPNGAWSATNCFYSSYQLTDGVE